MPATTKKPIKIVPNTIKTIPKVPLSPISKSKSFQEKLNDIQNNIDINIDDIPEDLLDIWDELQEDITPKLISKNYKLWLTIFTPFILPGIINGMSGKPAVPQPVVTVQEPAPDPKQIVNFAQKYFAEHGLELCKSLTKTDLNSMKQDLINNWGKGPNEFSKSFQDSYPVSKSRLENIYRSERHLAEYNGVLERAKIADHKYKQWRAVGDERSCDLCMSHDMETVPINEPFSNGEMTATGHPQCRCSMVTYSEDDYNEMKEDSAYLDDVVNTIKLNYNCPDSEKIGSGPGSCGGNKPNEKHEPEKPIFDGVPQDLKLGNEFKSEKQAVSRNEFNFKTEKKQGMYDTVYKIRVIPKKIPTEWKNKKDTLDDKNIWYDPTYMKEIPFGNGKSTVVIPINPEIENQMKLPSGKEKGYLFRGMSYEEFEGIKKNGYIKTEAQYNFDFQGDMTFFSDEKSTAANYASGFAPWQYAPTIDKPAIMIKVKDPGNHEKGTTEGEIGIRGKILDELITEVYVGRPVSMVEGYFEIVDDKYNNNVYRGNASPYKSNVIWEIIPYNKQKQDSSYLEDVTNFIKLNYNCPDSEKIGSGPGSCSGGNTSNLDKVSTLKNKIRELEKSVSEGKSTFDEAYEQYKSIQKELDLELEKEKLRNPDNAKITNDIVTDPEPITPYKALSDYQNYAYTAINDYLRKTNHVKQNPQQTKNIQNMIKTIDSEMENNPLKSDKLVFRADSAGISSDAFEKTGLTNIFKDTFGKESLTLEDFIKNHKLIDKIREKLVGYEYTEKAYLSTGSDKENTMNRFLAPSRNISKYGVTGLINLIVPKGTPAIRIADYTGLEDELGGKIDEYLIGRDQTIVIDQVYIRPADDNRLYLEYNAHIKTNEQKQNSEYLEDVTNFIKLNYNCPDSEKIGSGPGSCGGSIPAADYQIGGSKTTKIGSSPTVQSLYVPKVNQQEATKYVKSILIGDADKLIPDMLTDKSKALITEQDITVDEWARSGGVGMTEANNSKRGVVVSYAQSDLQTDVALHELGHAIVKPPSYSEFSPISKLDMSKPMGERGENTVESMLWTALEKDVPQDSKNTWIDKTNSGEAFADAFKMYNSPRGHLVLKEAFPNAYDVMKNVLGESKWDINVSPETSTFIKGLVTNLDKSYKSAGNKPAWEKAYYTMFPDGKYTTKELSSYNKRIKLVDDIVKNELNSNIKRDSLYLADATEFIKLNYKCKAGTVDDSNKCGLEQNTTSLTDRYDDKNTSSNVIAGYVRNDNKLVNSILSGDYDLSEKDKNRGLEKIRLLDNIFKDKLLPEKEITYRGISKSNIKNLPDNWNKIGNVISPGTFLSTSRSRSEAEGFITGGSNDDSILIKLILPRNTNAINVSDFVPKTSAYAYSFDENEVLVDRNTEFKVVDYRIENSRNMGELHIATWEAIPDKQKQDSAYLADAFETIKLNYNCPDSEKIGSGPGSCGGSKPDTKKEILEGQENKQEATLTNLPLGKPDFSGVSIQISKDVGLTNEKYRQEIGDNVVGALDAYRRTDYIGINSYLRNGNTKGQDINSIKDQIKLLDSAFIKKTSEPITTFRVLRGQDIINKYQPGSKIDEKAYLSTTISGGVGFFGADSENAISLQIEVPKGTPFVDISKATTGVENELLLPRNGKLLVKEVKDVTQKLYNLDENGNMVPKDVTRKYARVEYIPETRTFHEENIKSKILSLNDSKYPKDAVFRSKSRSSMTKNVELDILNNDNHVKILSDNIDRLHYQCDNLKIPRLRGIVADKNTKAGLASMADGILAVTPDMFRNDPDSEVDLRLSRNQERLNYINNKINSLESLIQSDKEKWTKNNPSLVNSGMKFEESTFYKTGYPWPKEINEYKSEKNNIMARINDLNTKKTNALIYTWKPGMPDSEKPFGASEYFPFEQSPKLLLDHEFGHHIHQLYGVKNAKSYAEPPLEKKIDQIYKKSEKDGTLIVPSKYAASDHQEWFAESYSLYVNGRDDLVTPGLIDLFKKIGVKHDN